MIKVGIIGYGHIGRAIERMLRCRDEYDVVAYDVVRPQNPPADAIIQILDSNDPSKFLDAILANDCIVVATPYMYNVEIAELCAQYGKVYFDMTEDNDVTASVHEIFNTVDGTCMTQCGLAPGAVSIITAQLIQEFNSIDNVSDIQIRVGALPLNANNEIKYYLSWSPEGLINEYCNPCRAMRDGKSVSLEPLEGYETVVIDGIEYEAFNTSGGLGFLDHTFATLAPNMNYKTMRYKGHRDRMLFLFNDLGLRNERPLLVDIFRRNVPYIQDDVVVIFVQVTGMIDGQRRVKQYVKKIYNDDQFTAIQRTTAAGLCTALHWYYSEPRLGGIITNNMVDGLENNPFWTVYR